MTGLDAFSGLPVPSKRAARRLIQRACVLAARDRNVRQHLRATQMVTLWTLEDWKFTWTVELDRGRVHFERRPARRPDLTLSWRTAEEFFRQVESGTLGRNQAEIEGGREQRRSLEPIVQAFCVSLQGLLQYPVDEDGESLL